MLGRRKPSGLWADDVWLSSHALEALDTYRENVVSSDEMRRVLRESAQALSRALAKLAAEVKAASDLSNGLPERLRKMCSAWWILRRRFADVVAEVSPQVEPELMRLLDFSLDYAKEFGDLVVAEEVLGVVSSLGLDSKEL